MTNYNKITALYSRLSVGDEDRDGGESNSIVNQKAFLERYAKQQKLTNIRHYIDDDESGRFFENPDGTGRYGKFESHPGRTKVSIIGIQAEEGYISITDGSESVSELKKKLFKIKKK